jgi:hypothetical protein
MRRSYENLVHLNDFDEKRCKRRETQTLKSRRVLKGTGFVQCDLVLSRPFETKALCLHDQRETARNAWEN